MTVFSYGTIAVTAILGLNVQGNNHPLWPRIQPVHERVTFKDAGISGRDTAFVLLVKSDRNVSIYKLECHNGNFDGTSVISFSGAFHCAFFSIEGDKPTSWNLLAADTEAEHGSDWLNRAE
jgi:hypothetical protein